MIASIVIPTCRRPALLRRCLDSLLWQSLAPGNYDIIVVDDGPDERTRQVVEAFAEEARAWDIPVRYVPMTGPRHGPAAARNAGWRTSHGGIIAFTDDDCVPDPDWLRAGLAAFEPDIPAVAGRIRVPIGPEPTDFERTTAGLERSPFATANAMYRRDALEACGGFDERFEAPWREDSDLFWSMLARFGRYAVAPGSVVMHPVRRAPWGVSVCQQRNHVFEALLYKKHPHWYRRFLHRPVPWHYYLMVGLAALALAAWALKAPAAAAGAAVGWALMTARFTAQRLRRTSKRPGHVAEMALTSIAIPPVAIFWSLAGAMKYRVWFW